VIEVVPLYRQLAHDHVVVGLAAALRAEQHPQIPQPADGGESATTLLARETAPEPDPESGHDDDDLDTDLSPVMVGDIPRVAKAAAVRKLAEVLTAQGHDEGAARAIAWAVVRPEEVRRRLALPDEDRVPGGVVFSVKATVWSAAVSTLSGNMREAESRRYPFAVGDGAATPLPSLHSESGSDTELTLDAPSREAVVASLNESAAYLKDNNNWDSSIRVHGVLRDVLAVPVRFQHTDGSKPAHMLASADGSSRSASAHRISRVDPEDIVDGFPDDDQAWRSYLGRTLHGSSLPVEDLTIEQAELIRVATMPAKIARPVRAARQVSDREVRLEFH
jgi:hypothetical protein